MALASIQKINKIFPIEGADRIEGVEVLGWKCVVRKGIFKEGDLCIYIEIDTIIPKYLLDETYQGEEVVRLRTVKMKGQISQGLVLPTWSFPEIFGAGTLENPRKFVTLYQSKRYDSINPIDAEVKEGDDVTEYLKIKKYEKFIPANMQGIIKGDFPSFLRKTDEVRIQSEPKLLEELNGKPFYITTKLDGTSATYFKYNGEFGVCSRNLQVEDGDNIYWNMARKYNIEEWLLDGTAIQGEICGEGIQKNPLGLKGQDLFIFNYFDIKDGLINIFDFDDEQEISSTRGCNFVPIEEMGRKFNYSLEELLEKAKGNYPSGKRKEGIVVRSLDQTISFKVVNNDYLLKDEE